MYEHILVATDGSDSARKAVDSASEMAKCFGAALTVIHVLMHGAQADEAGRLARSEHLVREVSKTVMPRIESVPGTMTELFRASQSTDEIARMVSALGDRIAGNAADDARAAGVETVDVKIRPGDYAETILATARDVGADMIVMGSRGLGGMKGLLMGSVSSKVSQHADCTVMIVR